MLQSLYSDMPTAGFRNHYRASVGKEFATGISCRRFQTALYSLDGARLGRGIDDVYAPSKDPPAVRVDTAWSLLSALDASLKRLLEFQECSDNAFRSRFLFSLLPWESETRNENAGRDATITATSASREVYSHVTSGRAFSVSIKRRISMARVTKARENTTVTASFWRTGMFNRQRSGSGNTMTDAEDGQRSKPGTRFPLTKKIGEDIERKLHGQKLVI